MKISRNHLTPLMAGLTWTLIAGGPAIADDAELFIAEPDAANRPNILFIIDNSGSMATELETQAPYDSSVAYAGSCDANRVYWRRNTGNPPDCSTANWFDLSAFECDAARRAFTNGIGRFTDGMAQFDAGPDERWETLDPDNKTRPVECRDDGGVHGNGTGINDVYAQSGDAGAPWSDNSQNEIAWGQTPVDEVYTTYDGNYVNWFYGPTVTSTRIAVVKDVAVNLVNDLHDVNIGLMQFNRNQGGPVIHALEDVATARTVMVDKISALTPLQDTPLSETLYEAGLYYRGAMVDFGDRQDPPFSVDAARTAAGSDTYKSPIIGTCQKNFIVLLSDGEPTNDNDAIGDIVAQPGFGGLIGSDCDGSGDGRCLDDVADYLFSADLSGALDDVQNVVTYTIGFAIDLPLLRSTATRGGGEYFTATDTASLTAALSNIVSQIIDTQTTFTAPSISVDSFNRTRTLNEIFVAVFRPTGQVHWPGNVKKYGIDPDSGQIIDADGNPAVDPATGFFFPTSRSFWSGTDDGADIEAGGAAARLPSPATRNLYTYLGNRELADSSNEVASSNGLIDASVLGIGAPGDPTVDQLLSFARGVDVTDEDGDGNVTEQRFAVGDPLHGQPVTIIYGGTPSNPDVNDAVVYVGTNDGYLHAIDPTTGVEKWAFLPPEFLDDIVTLYDNEATANKHYGVDGNSTVQLLLRNDDGVVDANDGEKAYLFFGMRRGGTTYYGLDVTDPDAPSVLWQLDGASLPDVGQSWSKPVPTRVVIGNGAGQNDDRLVLIFGGGYDTTQDSLVGSADLSGNAIYIVDSVSGNLLWHASSAGADRNLAEMNYSIPADIKVIDLDSDGFADRMYAADMGGQVWRFDIFQGRDPAELVNGGVIAQLGSSAVDPPDEASSRRFYASPDVAFVSNDADTFLHLGIGSGHRAKPNSIAAQDRFYALRDYRAFATRTQPEYDLLSASPITEADLVDITGDIDAIVPPGSAGWLFDLALDGDGEKVLAEARTFNDQVFFTTFTPDAGDPANCAPQLGTNRLYIMDILAGRPVTNLDQSLDEENLTESDRYVEFNGSLPSEVVFLFPSPEDQDCVGAQCTPPPIACVDLFCFSPDFINNPIRTFWSQESAY